LRSKHTDWHTILDYAFLHNITGLTLFTKLNPSSWGIPEDIKVEDEHFDQPSSMDLLIEADLSYEILRSGK